MLSCAMSFQQMVTNMTADVRAITTKSFWHLNFLNQELLFFTHSISTLELAVTKRKGRSSKIKQSSFLQGRRTCLINLSWIKALPRICSIQVSYANQYSILSYPPPLPCVPCSYYKLQLLKRKKTFWHASLLMKSYIPCLNVLWQNYSLSTFLHPTVYFNNPGMILDGNQ